jgi:hypothetical protein
MYDDVTLHSVTSSGTHSPERPRGGGGGLFVFNDTISEPEEEEEDTPDAGAAAAGDCEEREDWRRRHFSSMSCFMYRRGLVWLTC